MLIGMGSCNLESRLGSMPSSVSVRIPVVRPMMMPVRMLVRMAMRMPMSRLSRRPFAGELMG